MVIAIIGVLVALLLPAVQQAREAARRAQCNSKMKQIGVALHNYLDSHGVLPPSTTAPIGTGTAGWCSTGTASSGLPWTVHLLPFLDQQALFDLFDLDGTSISSTNVTAGVPTANRNAFLRGVAAYQCPSDPSAGANTPSLLSYFGVQGGGTTPDCNATGPGLTRVFNVNGMIYTNSSIRPAHVTDGMSKVFMVGETKYQLTPRGRADGIHMGWASSDKFDAWAMPTTTASAQMSINLFPGDGSDHDTITQQSRVFGSHHEGGCHFLMGDAAIKFVSENIDESVYFQVAIRDDLEPKEGL
ncbi:hypothetical protein Pan216_11500 [Planctomycetes bacterium Pan216]|uniref:DUF1559 domain-containing protein n=1 Tax=Kolteria novifilia TaxID=2527975 RepID=A0A518B017_9BACT|nr:hypothetical protein Pan216_11500 [Planctomycetes bacterium Pan216]